MLDAAEALREKRRKTLAKLDSLTRAIIHRYVWGPNVEQPLGSRAGRVLADVSRKSSVTGNTPPKGHSRVRWSAADRH